MSVFSSLIGSFLFIAFLSEVNMGFSQYMDDEYEKLFRRLNPPRYEFMIFPWHLMKGKPFVPLISIFLPHILVHLLS